MSVKPSLESSFLSKNEAFIEKDFNEFIIRFPSLYNALINALNQKDYGAYTTKEVLCGQLRFARNVTPSIVAKDKDVFRKVIDMGALKDTDTTVAVHGLAWDANNIPEFTRIYGTANDPGTSAISLESSLAPIDILVDNTNVNVTTTDNKTAYTICTVTLEYIY